MPRGSKQSYTEKQKRTAQHIEEGYEKRGTPAEKSKRIAWATVNKEYGKAGAKKMKSKSPAKRGGKKGGSRSKKRTLH